MRFAVAVVVALVAVVDAFGYVTVVSPRIEIGAPQRVLEKCDGLSAKGCTRFAEAVMLGECVREDGGWKLHASVQAIPQIFVTGVNWLAHEKAHVFDFKNLLTAHVNALGKARFAAKKSCQQLLIAATDAFPTTMQRIGRLSAERRDGMRAPSEDHLIVMQAKVMPELVDDRVADLADYVAPATRDAEYRAAKNRDLVGQRGQHVEASFRQSNAAVDSKELLAGRSFAKNVAVFVGRLFFNDDDDVVELLHAAPERPSAQTPLKAGG